MWPKLAIVLVPHALLPLALALECLVCRRTPSSLVPAAMSNSVFIFDAKEDDCPADTIQCDGKERFCLTAWAELEPGRHWIQKGCISAAAEGQGIGCTSEPLRMRLNTPFLQNLRTPPNATVIICVCNNGDLCNRGPAHKMFNQLAEYDNGTSAGFCSTLSFVLITLLCYLHALRWQIQ